MRTLSEQKVLKKLDIPDFRHITREKVVDFISLYDRMDPEVAKKALDQFPDFAKTMYSIARDVKETALEAMKENGESVKECYNLCTIMMESLKIEMDKDISFEERQYYIEQMKWAIAEAEKLHKDNQGLIIKVLAAVGIAAVSIGGAVGAGIGINSHYKNM